MTHQTQRLRVTGAAQLNHVITDGAKRMNLIGLSFSEVFKVRNTAFAAIREHSADIDAVAGGIADLDVALQLSLSEKNIDEMQGVISAARRLSAILGGGAA